MRQRSWEYNQLLEVLAKARDKAGITKRELSRMLERPHSYIAKIESSERRLDVIEFIEIARALRVDPKVLLAAVLEATEM